MDQDVCSVCEQSLNPVELVDIDGHIVCAQCKPMVVQELREGVPQKDEVGSEAAEGHYWLGLSLLFFIVAMGGIIYTLPRFVRLYDDMLAGEPLPTLTAAFCSVPVLGYIAGTMLGVQAICIIHFTAKSEQVRRALRVSVTLFSIFLAVLYVIAVFSPLIVTVVSLNGLR